MRNSASIEIWLDSVERSNLVSLNRDINGMLDKHKFSKLACPLNLSYGLISGHETLLDELHK